jgi:hypothetical protein
VFNAPCALPTNKKRKKLQNSFTNAASEIGPGAIALLRTMHKDYYDKQRCAEIEIGFCIRCWSNDAAAKQKLRIVEQTTNNKFNRTQQQSMRKIDYKKKKKKNETLPTASAKDW